MRETFQNCAADKIQPGLKGQPVQSKSPALKTVWGFCFLRIGSSTGRAPASNAGGCRFVSCLVCHFSERGKASSINGGWSAYAFVPLTYCARPPAKLTTQVRLARGKFASSS